MSKPGEHKALSDDDICALQEVRLTLEAIANKYRLVGDVIEPVANIGAASKRAKYALGRLEAVAKRHDF